METPTDCLLPIHFPGGSLRRLRPSDLGSFQAYRNIPELGRYQGWTSMTEAEALAFLMEMAAAPLFQPGQWVQLGIADLHTDALVGDIGIHLSDLAQTGEVGFTLAPSAQGRGLARAAVKEALRLFFIATSASQILGVTDARNARSIRLLECVGFECREARTAVFRDEPCTELVYVLPRESVAANNLSTIRPTQKTVASSIREYRPNDESARPPMCGAP